MTKKIYAFLQMYNEETSGHLKRCLENCKRWADEIIIYDDKSTDNSVELAKKYTSHIILGAKNEWAKETIHKQQMLEYIHNMEKKPDWILWVDCDEIIDKNCIYNLQDFCKKNANSEIDAFSFQQLNLWRGKKYYRTDGMLYGESPNGYGWFIRLWRYHPNLHMKAVTGSDQRLYPINIKKVEPCEFKIIHYGFSDYKKMMKHIGVHNSNKQQLIDTASGVIYEQLVARGVDWAKAYVVNGKGVSNMFLNESKLTVKEIPDEWFPEENVPMMKYEKPEPFPLSELIPYDEL